MELLSYSIHLKTQKIWLRTGTNSILLLFYGLGSSSVYQPYVSAYFSRKLSPILVTQSNMMISDFFSIIIYYRDVTVLVNDGTKTYDMMIEDSHDVVGCNTNIRYHAERGDFSVNDATRAKVLINGSRYDYCHMYIYMKVLFFFLVFF